MGIPERCADQQADHRCRMKIQGDSGITLLALLGLSPQSSTRTMHGVMHVGRPPAEGVGLRHAPSPSWHYMLFGPL